MSATGERSESTSDEGPVNPRAKRLATKEVPRGSTQKRKVARRLNPIATHITKRDIATGMSRFVNEKLPELADVSTTATNLVRFQNALKGMEILNQRERPVGLPKAVSLDFVLSLPVYNGRDCFVQRISPPKPSHPQAVSWKIFLRDRANTEGFSSGIEIPCHTNHYSRQDCERIGPVIASFLSRWPHEVSNKMGASIKRAILALATELVLPEHPRNYSTVQYIPRDRRYAIDINFFDPDTGDWDKHREFCDADSIINTDIPDVPNYCKFGEVYDRSAENQRTFQCQFCQKKYKAKNGLEYHLNHDKNCKASKAAAELAGETILLEARTVTAGESSASASGGAPASLARSAIPDDISEADRPKHVAAEKLCKFVLWKLHGKVMKKSDCSRLCVSYFEAYAKHYTVFRGVYGGKPIIGFSRRTQTRSTELSASRAVQKDLTKTPPKVRINSLSKLRLVPAVDAMTQEWLTTGNIVEALQTLARVSDNVNSAIAAGEPPQNECECSESMSAREMHPCGSCLKQVLCARLRYDMIGVRVCSYCMTKEGKASVPEVLVKNSLWRNFRWECSVIGEDWTTDNNQKILNAAWGDIEEQFKKKKDMTWIDDYHTNSRVLESEVSPGRQERNLLIPSVDAVNPFHDVQNRYRAHCAGNIAVTTYYLNAVKHFQLPGVLQLISEFRKGDQSEGQTEAFIERVDDLWEVRMKTALKRKSRLAQPFDQGELVRHQAEWQAGIPNTNERVARSYARIPKVPYRNWRPDGVERINQLIREIEKAFDGSIYRASDDSPYPFYPSTMPPDWCWWNCWAFFSDRVFRMYMLCNRQWTQVDTTETLLFEACWQFLDPKYKEFLGLPLSIYVRHPLRVAVAHMRHGQQLRSGWAVPTPSSIDDRDETLNNMLFETCSSNYMKSNARESVCKEALEDFDKVQVPTKWYDPRSVAKSAKKEDSMAIEGEWDEDEYVAEELDESFVADWDKSDDD